MDEEIKALIKMINRAPRDFYRLEEKDRMYDAIRYNIVDEENGLELIIWNSQNNSPIMDLNDVYRQIIDNIFDDEFGGEVYDGWHNIGYEILGV